LLLHRGMGADDVAAGIDAALAAGSVDPEVVAIEARQAADRGHTAGAVVVPIEAARCAPRPAPDLAGYDGLLAAGGTQ
jgi:hypothetical protein